VNTCRKTTETLRTTEVTDDIDEVRKSALSIHPRKSVHSVVLSVSVVDNARICHPTSEFGFNPKTEFEPRITRIDTDYDVVVKTLSKTVWYILKSVKSVVKNPTNPPSNFGVRV
jgi:hypothetical protein